MTPTEFKSWRKRCGLTQAQAGNALGYTQQHICALEKGKFPVTKAIALATLGYECREKANDFREMLAFVETEGISKQMTTLHDVKKAMRDPAYWRDQDPKVVEAVREVFRNLYSDEHPGLVEDPQEPFDTQERKFINNLKGGFWS